MLSFRPEKSGCSQVIRKQGAFKGIRKSDGIIVPKKWGNAYGGKGTTQHRPFKGNRCYTQR